MLTAALHSYILSGLQQDLSITETLSSSASAASNRVSHIMKYPRNTADGQIEQGKTQHGSSHIPSSRYDDPTKQDCSHLTISLEPTSHKLHVYQSGSFYQLTYAIVVFHTRHSSCNCSVPHQNGRRKTHHQLHTQSCACMCD